MALKCMVISDVLIPIEPEEELLSNKLEA